MATPRRWFVIDVIPYDFAANGDLVYTIPMRAYAPTQWGQKHRRHAHWCRHRVRATSTASAMAKAIAEHNGSNHHSL